MLKNLGTEFKVGLFAVVALVTLGYMFFVLSPEAFENKEYAQYYTVLKNAAGIVAKSHVKTSGVSIGKVKSVALEGGTSRVVIEIERAVKIPVGSRIEIRSVGFLGDKHLEIIRPADDGKYVEDKGFIPQSDDAIDMETLISLIGDVAKDVKKVTGTLANVLGTKKGEQSIQNIVDNIEGVTADFKATTATLRKVIGDRENDWQDIVTDVRGSVADLRSFSANLKEVLDDDNKAKIDRILANFDDTMVDVKGSAKNISLISEKIEKGEGTIGKLVNDDTTLTELEGALKDIRKVIAPATKLQVDVDVRGEFRKDDTSQFYFNMLFRTRPDRYYLLGLTDGKEEKIDTTSYSEPGEETDDGQPTTTTHEVIKKEKRLRFNLQIAKRWYFATLRAGLFETTGGFATDLHFWGDRIKLTGEAFDFDTNNTAIRRTAHVKAYVSVLFYNHIYAMAGVDDPTRTDPETGKVDKDKNYFFGGGVTFTDDDLKAIFGTAALTSSL
jgi:phospholipid/cholesterol/gamma-HCH transport system substrate-binding protein